VTKIQDLAMGKNQTLVVMVMYPEAVKDFASEYISHWKLIQRSQGLQTILAIVPADWSIARVSTEMEGSKDWRILPYKGTFELSILLIDEVQLCVEINILKQSDFDLLFQLSSETLVFSQHDEEYKLSDLSSDFGQQPQQAGAEWLSSPGFNSVNQKKKELIKKNVLVCANNFKRSEEVS